ncbi:MAG: tyrosine--tRNA ligase [Myxococcales bacterium]|nr:tyrosine--tRNA ligase [Myxococcales bacterium]
MADTFKSNTLTELSWRGFIEQMTHAEELDAALADASVTLYAGFDPSADSLHVGSLIPLMGLAFFHRHGHQPVLLAGGATGRIGDPSGKSEERVLKSDDEILANLEGISAQLRHVMHRALEMHPEGLGERAGSTEEILFVNNNDWMSPWSYIDFLRDVGKFFRVNAMMAKDSVRSRLEEREQGISYTEFSYMLIQAYDFLHLFEHHGCSLQVGGSDQWGNITAGTDLIRRKLGDPAFGLTFPLLTTASGQKLGKTEKGAVWLDAERTSPYEFYQYWRQREDADVVTMLRLFTFLPKEEIDALAAEVAEGRNRGQVQARLAHEVTTLIHGEEEADKAVRASKMLFGEAIQGLNDRDLRSVFKDVPSTEMSRDRLGGELTLAQLFVETELVSSKGEAKRLFKQNGGYLNNAQGSAHHTLSEADLASETMLVLRAGKKKYHVVRFV